MKFRKFKSTSGGRSSVRRPKTLSGTKAKKALISRTIQDRKYAEAMAFLYDSDAREIKCMINSIDRMLAAENNNDN